jgi:hypothetical protein
MDINNNNTESAVIENEIGSTVAAPDEVIDKNNVEEEVEAADEVVDKNNEEEDNEVELEFEEEEEEEEAPDEGLEKNIEIGSNVEAPDKNNVEEEVFYDVNPILLDIGIDNLVMEEQRDQVQYEGLINKLSHDKHAALSKASKLKLKSKSPTKNKRKVDNSYEEYIGSTPQSSKRKIDDSGETQLGTPKKLFTSVGGVGTRTSPRRSCNIDKVKSPKEATLNAKPSSRKTPPISALKKTPTTTVIKKTIPNTEPKTTPRQSSTKKSTSTTASPKKTIPTMFTAATGNKKQTSIVAKSIKTAYKKIEEVNEIVTATESEIMTELYRQVISKDALSHGDNTNPALVKEFQDLERIFIKKLFIVSNRQGRNLGWPGWIAGIGKCAVLTPYGKVFATSLAGKMMPSVQKVLCSKASRYTICSICWANPLKELARCMFSTDIKWNHTNCAAHIRTAHPDIDLQKLADAIIVLNKGTGTSQKIIPIDSNSDSDSEIETVVEENKDSKTETKKKISPFAVKVLKPTEALKSLYYFFNEANIAINQTDNVHFKKFINYVIDNGTNYKYRKQELYFSRYKYKKIENIEFSTFVHNIRNIVKFCRDFYVNETNDVIMHFICVSHDGWDSKDNDVLGVSIHFIIPVYWQVVNLAIGLKRTLNKKSNDLSNEAKKILNRYVIINIS